MNSKLAEGVGFEPTVGEYPTTVFKTVAFNHSAIPPRRGVHSLADRRLCDPGMTSPLPPEEARRCSLPRYGSSLALPLPPFDRAQDRLGEG